MEVTERMLDDLADSWHNSNSERPLYEFLGMTGEEYGYWVNNGFDAWKKRYCNQFS
jgi:hypothetical protein